VTTDEAGYASDIRLITRLKMSYARLVDEKQWAKLAACFTDDFEFDGQWSINGAEAFVERTRSQLHTASTRHSLGIPEIEVTSAGTATAVWPFSDVIDQRHHGTGIHRSGSGQYHERYCKVDGRWRIAAMRIIREQVRCAVFVDGVAVRGETVHTQEQLREWLQRERRAFAH
jgi:hypothetical protein